MASLVKNGKNYGLIWSENGKQTRESLKTDNKKKAKRKKAELETKYYEGEHDPFKRKWYEKSRLTADIFLKEAVEEFILYKSRHRGEKGWSDSVAQREKYVMRKFVRHVGDKPVIDITEQDLEDFYYREKVTSDHTRNGNYISINTFLNWCIQQEYIESKPEYKPKKPQRKIPKFIHPKELSTLIHHHLNQIDEQQVKPKNNHSAWVVLGWMVLAGTGMRPGELAKLKLNHVQNGYIILGEDFTTKVRAERSVPLLFESQQAINCLTNPRFRQREPSMRDSDYLLGRKPNYSKQQLSRKFTKTWEKAHADKPKRVLYNLKDMFCVRFLYDGAGRALTDLAQILGHSSLDTTRKYIKAVPYGTRVRGTIWDYPPTKNVTVSQ